MESESQQHEITRLAAFFLWEQRGCPFGTPEVDWFRAEEEMRAQTEQPSWKPPLISAAETVGQRWEKSLVSLHQSPVDAFCISANLVLAQGLQ